MTSNKRKPTYRSINERQALNYLAELKSSNTDIRHELSRLKYNFSQKNPKLPLIKKITLQLLEKSNFKKLRNYIKQLSILNVKSGQKVIPIYRELTSVRTPMQQIQTGDFGTLESVDNTSGKSLVQQILSSQINSKNVTIIPRTKRPRIIQQTKVITIVPDKAKGKKARAKTKYRLKNKDKVKKNKTKHKKRKNKDKVKKNKTKSKPKIK